MEWNLQHIFTPQPIMGVTINTVFLSPSFRQALYIASAFILIFSTFFFVIKKSRFTAALKKAVIITFFASGLLYAIHADTGWAIWLMDDARKFYGLTPDAKLSGMEDGLYDFSHSAKRVLRSEYMVFSSDSYLALRAEYFLLPLHKRERADDIVVLADDVSRYERNTRTFTRENIKIENVEPVFVFAENAYILRKR